MIHTVNDYQELSVICADKMVDCIKKKTNAVLCLATGNSVSLAYELFIKRVQKENIDTSSMRILKLDEWLDIPLTDESTCEYFLAQSILTPLNISSDRYLSFKSMGVEFGAELQRIRSGSVAWGGIDLITLGIGMNGHLGLNEPGETLEATAHVSTLDTKTKTHQMIQKKSVTRGITLGLEDIMKARYALLLLTGERKVDAVNVFMKGNVTTQVPATIMHLHPSCDVLVDGDIYNG